MFYFLSLKTHVTSWLNVRCLPIVICNVHARVVVNGSNIHTRGWWSMVSQYSWLNVLASSISHKSIGFSGSSSWGGCRHSSPVFLITVEMFCQIWIYIYVEIIVFCAWTRCLRLLQSDLWHCTAFYWVVHVYL